MECINQRVTFESSLIIIQNALFSKVTATVSGGVINLASNDVSGLIKNCYFYCCKTSATEGGALNIINGKKYTIKCTSFRKNGAVASPNFYVSKRESPFELTMQNLALCQCEAISNKPNHLDIFGGNSLLFNHVNCSDNNVINCGIICDYFIGGKHDQFSFFNFADSYVNDGYFSHDQLNMPTNLIYDRINFINITATNFFYSLGYEKHDQFFETNFVKLEKLPNFNKNVSFINSYFCLEVSNTVSAAFINILETIKQNSIEETCVLICSKNYSHTNGVRLLYAYCVILIC